MNLFFNLAAPYLRLSTKAETDYLCEKLVDDDRSDEGSFAEYFETTLLYCDQVDIIKLFWMKSRFHPLAETARIGHFRTKIAVF